MLGYRTWCRFLNIWGDVIPITHAQELVEDGELVAGSGKGSASAVGGGLSISSSIRAAAAVLHSCISQPAQQQNQQQQAVTGSATGILGLGPEAAAHSCKAGGDELGGASRDAVAESGTYERDLGTIARVRFRWV